MNHVSSQENSLIYLSHAPGNTRCIFICSVLHWLVSSKYQQVLLQNVMNVLTFYISRQDRMWRKTRSRHENNVCVGVDPNRNFDGGFGGPGSSGSPCSDTYRGPVVESEKLTQGLSNFIKQNQGKIEVMFFVSI